MDGTDRQTEIQRMDGWMVQIDRNTEDGQVDIDRWIDIEFLDQGRQSLNLFNSNCSYSNPY